MLEAGWFESGRHNQVVYLFIVACLGLGGRDVADRLAQTAIVESIQPFESGEFHRLDVSPWPALADHLRAALDIALGRVQVVVAT